MGVKSPASAWFGKGSGIAQGCWSCTRTRIPQSRKPPIPTKVGGRQGCTAIVSIIARPVVESHNPSFRLLHRPKWNDTGVWVVTGRWLLDRKCSEEDAPCHGRLVERHDGVWRGRHSGRLGVLGRMTVCAIIEHRRCRSRPNDQMREGSRGIDKVGVVRVLRYSDLITTTVIALQSHRSAKRPHYYLQQGIPPNEGKTNELLMLMLPLQACPRLWLEALRLSFVCPPEILMIRKSSWVKSIFCLEPNQMTPQALHDSTWSMPLSLLRLASSP